MQSNVSYRCTLLLIATLVAAVYLAPTFLPALPSWWNSFLPADRIHLGLDLQGGSHLVLEVEVDKAVETRLERNKDEIAGALRERNISGASVERVRGTELHLKVPEASAGQAKELLTSDFPNLAVLKTATAAGVSEFFLALTNEEVRSIRDYAVDQSLETIRNRIDQFGVSEPVIQRQGQHEILIQLPGIQDPERAKDIIGKTALLEFKLVDDSANIEEAVRHGPPAGDEILYGYAGKGNGATGAQNLPYVLESRTLMTGENVADAHVRPGPRLQGPHVELVLNAKGAHQFEQLTAAHVNRHLAIVLDNRVYSAPVIRERIGGGRASITGNFTLQEAHDLAIVLHAGALPAPVRIAEERTVGPSLGKDSIQKGVMSFILGAALVIGFMVAYYKGAGLIAIAALIFNILFLLAILAGFHAVLTLPGIAGLVLTIGMAVDANVLINERVREELRAGKQPRFAIEAGYRHALPAILDSNITTFLSGAILFQFGTGPVKGFAVILCVGILTSVITSVYVTRIFYDYRMSRRRLERISI